MEVPLLDLKAQYARYRDQVPPAVESVLDSQMVCNGPPVRQLEQEMAAYCGCSAAVGVSSGTDALLSTLMTLGIGAGHEVITSPFTFFATAGVIWRVGATPVFVDIEPDTFNIDPAKIEAAITEKTKAIIPVHLFGQMAQMDAITAIAKKHDLCVIEDAAQSIGATYHGHKAGSIGTAGCLSFYPTKNLGAPGDGGMIVTQDAGLAERLAITRNHGQGKTYHHQIVGGNFRMDSIVAAILSIKLQHLDQWTEERRRHAARYNELLSDVAGVVVPHVQDGNESIFHQYVMRVPRRDAMRKFLADQGISTGVYYPLSLHEQECFAELGYKHGDFPESEKAADEVLALPIYAELTDDQITYVADKVKQFSCPH